MAQLMFGRVGKRDATVDLQVGVNVHQFPRREQLPFVVVHRFAGEQHRRIGIALGVVLAVIGAGPVALTGPRAPSFWMIHATMRAQSVL